jgi:cytochrome c oxidase assembly protein subunit 15
MTRFRTLARASLFATALLVTIGGLVRATKSGLGCGDDWPHCSGRVIPVFGHPAVAIEFSHRMAALAVILLIGTLATMAVRNFRDDRRVLWTSVGAFALVLFQAVLGAIVVWLHLKAESVVLHLGTALALVALLVYLNVTLAEREGTSWMRDAVVSRWAKFAAACVFLLLLVGSYVSGTEGAGKVFSDWPLMNGKVVPDLAVEAQALHFFHRALAAFVGVIVFVVGLRVVKRKAEMPEAARLAHVAMGLFAVEVLIGAANVWTGLNSGFVTAHLAIGAAIWGSLVGMALVTRDARETVPVRSREMASAALDQGA